MTANMKHLLAALGDEILDTYEGQLYPRIIDERKGMTGKYRDL